jgi:hypothetical protein
MASKIKIKRSSVEGKVPLTSDLDLGELAINTYDGKLYLKKNDGVESIVDFTGFTGSQGVIGYTGSASTEIGYTGSAGEGSSVTTSTTAPVSPTAGDLWWNSETGQLKIYYQDIDSSQWVDASPSTLGYTGSASTEIGFTGSQGVQGVTGFTGSASTEIGFTGSQGTTGFTGSQGIQGVTGFTGSLGFVGSRGNVGFTGSVGIQGATGFTGSQGIQGATGFTGSQGTTGFTGSQGTTGFTGSQGIQGVTGFTGSVGFVGSKGDTGFVGSRGTTGFTGSQGIQGVTGFTGSQGIQGVTGFTGSVGFVGSKGDIGFVGSAGPNNSINAANDTDTTLLFPVMVGAAGSAQTPKVRTTATALSYNASTGALTASSFVGALTGNAATASALRKPSVNPTLDLDFANNDYTIYDSFANSYTDKPYADMLTVTNGVATGVDAIGVLRNSVANNIRLVFDPETGVSQGALVEPAATNLSLYSEQFDNTYWVRSGLTTVSSNVLIAPDDTLTADKMVEGTSDTEKFIRSTAQSLAAGTYTQSVFWHESSERSIQLRPVHIGDTSATSQVTFIKATLSLGSVTGNGVSATAKNLGKGWWRISLTFTITGTRNVQVGFQCANEVPTTVYTGDGTSGIFIWGAQLETGSVPTSYIKTEASTVTRVLDSIIRTLGNEFNQEEFTVFWNIGEVINDVRSTVAGGTNGGTDRVGITSTSGFQIVLSGSVVINRTFPAPIVSGDKVVGVYKKGDYRVYKNGVLEASSTNTALSPSIPFNAFNINRTIWNGGFSNTTYKNIKLYPRALTEAECIALTTL